MKLRFLNMGVRREGKRGLMRPLGLAKWFVVTFFEKNGIFLTLFGQVVSFCPPTSRKFCPPLEKVCGRPCFQTYFVILS
jgi:hypothetical protein